MRILIGYDGSECADGALKDLERAGLPPAATALIVSVAEQWLPPPPPSSYEVVEASLSAGQIIESPSGSSQAVEQAYNRAFQAAQLVQSIFPAWTIESEAYTGSPAREILKRAGEWAADLIVVGSHGRSALGRLILGSVSQRVVTNAHCSVRVARYQAKQKDLPARIIIGVDGSQGSQAAVRKVAARFWPDGSQVLLVTSVDALHMYAMQPEDKFAYMRSVHREAEGALRTVGFEVESIIKEEDPKVLLIGEAERWVADSIFVGARGLNAVERFFLGSISSAVVSRAHCSVEVVREE
jgi:nucleotide-binding universal stress UspA family protein